MVEHSIFDISTQLHTYWAHKGVHNRYQRIAGAKDAIRKAEEFLYVSSYGGAKNRIVDDYEGYIQKVQEAKKAYNALYEICIEDLLEVLDYCKEQAAL